jgi:hypothetical protein
MKLKMATTGWTELPAKWAAIVPDSRRYTKMPVAISTGRVSYREVGCDFGSLVTVARSPISFPLGFPTSASVFTASRPLRMKSGSASKNLAS